MHGTPGCEIRKHIHNFRNLNCIRNGWSIWQDQWQRIIFIYNKRCQSLGIHRSWLCSHIQQNSWGSRAHLELLMDDLPIMSKVQRQTVWFSKQDILIVLQIETTPPNELSFDDVVVRFKEMCMNLSNYNLTWVHECWATQEEEVDPRPPIFQIYYHSIIYDNNWSIRQGYNAAPMDNEWVPDWCGKGYVLDT